MQLECFRQNDRAIPMIPASQERAWMDATPNRFAYRCLPLTIANTAGWVFECPSAFEAEWTGEADKSALQLTYDDPGAYPFATSHFGAGIITMHTGWVFRTPEGVHVLVQGLPNYVKDGVQPLSGIIETDWLPFGFTMNWRMTRPGKVRFERGEPMAFITLIRPAELETVQPIERRFADDPEFEAEHLAWSQSRGDFIARLRSGDPDTVKAGWQRHYTRGVTPTGAEAPAHVSKRRLKPMLALPKPQPASFNTFAVPTDLNLTMVSSPAKLET